MATSGRPLGSMIVELGLNSTNFENSLKSVQNQFKLAKSAMRANLETLSTSESAYDKASGKVSELSKVMQANERQIQVLKTQYDEAKGTTGQYSDTTMRLGKQINNAERQQASYARQLKTARASLTAAANGADKYQSALRRNEREIHAQVSSLTAQGKATEANVTKYHMLGKELNNYSGLITAEKAKLAELQRTKGEDSNATKEQRTRLVELESQQKKAQYEYDELGKKVKRTTLEQARASDSVRSFGSKVGAVGGKIKSFGSSMTTGFTLPVVAGLGYGMKEATKFDSQMQVIKNNLRTSGESVRDSVKETTEMTRNGETYAARYGVSVHKIADGYLDLVKRGYSGQQAVGSMKSMIEGSIASGDDFNDVIKVSAQTMESFGLRAKTTAGMVRNSKITVNDLAYAADATSTNFQDLGVGMQYVGSTAHQAGFSLSETASAMGILSNNGLEADKAGTGLHKAIQGLISPSAQAKGDLKKLGLTTQDFVDKSGKMKSMSDIFGMLSNHMKGLKANEKTDIFHALFGTTGQAAGVILANNASKLAELNKRVKDSYKNNYVANLAAKNGNTAKQNMEKMKQSVDVLAIQMGTLLLPALTKVTNIVSKFAQKLIQAPRPIRQLALGAVIAAAALGPLAVVMGNLMITFQGLSKLLGAAFLPVSLTVAVIAALAVGFALAYSNCKPFHDAVDKLIAKLRELFSGLGKWLSQVPGNFKKATQAISGFFRSIPKTIVNMGNSIKNGFNKIMGSLGQIGTNMINAILKPFKAINKFFQPIFKVMIQSFKNFAKALMYALILPVGIAVIITKPLVKPLQNIMKTLINWLRNAWNSFVNFLKAIYGPVERSWKAVWTAIQNFMRPIVANISNFMKTTIQSAANFWNNTVKGIANFWRMTWTNIINFLRPILSAINNSISSTINAIRGTWDNVFGAIRDFFVNIWNSMNGFLRSIFSGMASFIGNTSNGISSAWNSTWNSMGNFFGSVWRRIKEYAQDGINGVIHVINAGVNAIDTVWKFFTGHRTSVSHLSPVHFAQGGIIEGHYSMINDGAGPNWKELVQMPDGQLMMSHQRNWTGLLPSGARIYSGDETKEIMDGAGVKHYADGGLVDGAEKLIDWGKGSLLNIKSMLGDKVEAIVKFMAHPIKNTESLFEEATSKAMPKVEAFRDLAEGIVHKLEGSIGKWVKKHLSSVLDKLDGAGSASSPNGKMSKSSFSDVAKVAAALMHQSLSSSDISRLYWQAFVESGVNPATGGGYDDHDGTGLPVGLFQYKLGTWQAWAVRGHENIKSAIDQIMAVLNDSNWRSDLAPLGSRRGWGPSGYRMMADGGFVNTEQLVHMAEGDKPEAVVPLTNRSRAMQILAQIKDQYGLDVGGNSSDTAGVEDNQKQELAILKETNDTLLKILGWLIGSNNNVTNNSKGNLNSLSNKLDDLGLIKRKIRGFQS